MIAVIFEVQPWEGCFNEYLEIAGTLKLELAQIPGFISVERFQSTVAADRYLSLSFWRDEESVLAWRQQSLHQEAQAKGRQELFKHFRIRVASVLRDYEKSDDSAAR